MVFGGLAAIFGDFEFAGLLNRQRWADKRPGYASRKFGGPTSVRRCGIAAVQIRQTFRSFLRRRCAVAKKNDVKIEWVVSQGSSPHQPVLFRPNISLNKMKRPIE